MSSARNKARAPIRPSVMRSWGAVLVWLMATTAHAQELAPSEWQPGLHRGQAAFEDGRWDAAAEALGPAWQSLADFGREERHGFECELGSARIRIGEPGLTLIGDGLATGDRARRAACATMAADALAAQRRTLRAAVLYLHARTYGADVSAQLAALPENARTGAQQMLEQLRNSPVLAAVGPVRGVTALIERLETVTWMSRPTRVTHCFAEEDWSSARRGVVTCRYSDAPQPTLFGGRGYPMESFVWERARGGLRVVASFSLGLAYDCEVGHTLEGRRFERLTAQEHGIDGYLLTVEDSLEVAVGNTVGTLDRTFVYACARSTGTCARVEESVARCAYALRPSMERRCTERYAGAAIVREGLLTVRIDDGELPPALRAPIDLRSFTPATPAVAQNLSMRGCRVEVRDPAPPLNVRARPGRRAPVVGTLDDRAVVVIAGREGARWVEIRAPLRGYVWAQNLRRVCGAR